MSRYKDFTRSHSSLNPRLRKKPRLDRRRLSPFVLLAALGGCLGDDDGSDAECDAEDRACKAADDSELDVSAATDLEAAPAVATCTLPPGDLVDTQAGSAWREGRFSVSDDGAAEYHLPLWVPDGRGGLEPELALHYNSRSGNGPVGVGWALSGLSAITPCPRTIAHDGRREELAFLATDAFCLDGQRLRPIDEDGTASEYRTERDPFARIKSVTLVPGEPPTSFRVETRSGTTLTYGERLEAYRLSATSDPENPSFFRSGTKWAVAAWALTRIADRNGNAITIEYDTGGGTAETMWAEEMLPIRITYAPGRRVEFVYGDDRPDPVDRFQAGGILGAVHTQVRRRLSAVEMYDGTTLLRKYSLSYHDDDHSITGRSLLERITECDGAAKCLAPLEFDWSPGSYSFVPVPNTVTDVGTSALNGYTFTAGDINGDGADDLLYGDAVNSWKMRFSDKEFGFNVALNTGIAHTGNPLRRARFRPLDYNRDGLLDLVTEVKHGFLHTKFALYKATGSSYELVPNLDDALIGNGRGQVTTAYVVDLDGNGFPDYLSPRFESDTRQRWYFRRNSASGFGPMTESAVTTDFNSSLAYRIRATDFNADGLGSLLAWPNANEERYRKVELDEDGALSSSTHLLNLPFRKEPENRDRRSLHLADINCDGLEDAIYPLTGLTAQLNSGSGFSPLIPGPTDYLSPLETVPAPSPPSAEPGVRVADFNSDGCDDVLLLHGGTPTGPADFRRGMQLYTWRDGGFRRIPLGRSVAVAFSLDGIQPLDFDGDGAMDIAQVIPGNPPVLQVLRRQGGMPDRMTRVNVVGLGARVEVDYTTLADRRHHSPGDCTGSRTCLRRGGSIVAKHRLVNGLGDPSPWHEFQHTYIQARADLLGRGWLGFKRHYVEDRENGAQTFITYDNETKEEMTIPGGTSIVYPLAGVTTDIGLLVGPPTDRYHRQIARTNTFRPLAVPGTYTVDFEGETDSDFEGRSRTSEFEYDNYGNRTKSTVTWPGSNRVDTLTYDNTEGTWLIGKLRTWTAESCTGSDDCKTRESTFDYDDSGNLEETIVEPNSADHYLKTILGRDGFGNVTSVTTSDQTEEETRETTITYDTVGLYPTGISNALDHVTQMTFHSGLGVLLNRTDPNGVCTTMKYDGFGRLRETHYADGYFEKIDNFGPLLYLTTVPDGLGGTVLAGSVLLDNLGRERESQSLGFGDRNSVIRSTYDRRGRLATRSRPFFLGHPVHTTTYSYDLRDRLTRVVDPDTFFVRHEYRGREVHTFDREGVESYTVERPDGLLEARYEDDPNSTSWLRTGFEYGPFGRLEKSTAADGTIQTMDYDQLGQRIEHVDPSTGTTAFEYSAFGELTAETTATGERTDLEYDLLGRLKRVTAPEGVTVNVWDTATNGLGKLANATSPDGVVTRFFYDSVGRSSKTTWQIEGTSHSIDTDYDVIGRLSRITYPALAGPNDRLRVDYIYKTSSYLSEVRDAVSQLRYWRADTRNASAQLQQETFGNNVVGNRSYQPTTGLLAAMETKNPAGQLLDRLTYGYDPNRNVASRADLVGDSRKAQAYDYDTLNRLITWTISSTPTDAVTTNFTYDELGSLQTEIAPGRNITYAYGENGAPPHALTSRNGGRYTYDAAGRQVTAPGRTVTYNRFNLPKTLTRTDGQVTQFAYSADGARVLKRDPGETVISLAGLFERRTAANIRNIHSVIADGRTVAQVTRTQTTPTGTASPPQVVYLHADLQGSTIQTTGPSGQVTEELFYDPFGRRTSRTYEPIAAQRRDLRLGYTSHDHDDELGLINMKGRIYDPVARSFLSPDPFVVDPIFSQSHNRYSYVHNNPATFIDPSGFTCKNTDGTECPTIQQDSTETPGGGSNSGGKVPCCGGGLGTLWQLTGYGGAARGGGLFDGRGGGDDGGVDDDDGGTDQPSPDGGWDGGPQPYHSGNGPNWIELYGPRPLGSSWFSAFIDPGNRDLDLQVLDFITPSPMGQRLGLGPLGNYEEVAGRAAADPEFRAFIRRSNALSSPDSFDNELNVMGGLVGPKTSHAKGAPKLLGTGRMMDHHIFPQQFRKFFQNKGIDIDQFTVRIGEASHLKGIHGRGLGSMPGRWNARWSEFINANPGATAKEIYQFAGRLMDEFGLSGLPLTPYTR